MNKKLLAAAVASALAVPVTASAQVAISGIFKVGISNISMGGTVTPGRANDSQIRVDDNSSRILFNVTEDLGGGLAAIGQLDLRFAPDQAGAAPANNPIGSGNTYVGLRSTSWGTVSLGRWDLHYGKQPEDLAAKAGALMASSTSLMDYQLSSGANVAVANATRTANVIKWDSPNWGGLALTAAYSTSPLAASSEGDMGVAPSADGMGMNFAAAYTAANWQVGASMWEAETEAVNTATTSLTANPRLEQSSQSFWGYMRFGGFKVGVGANTAELKNAGVVVSDRMTFTVPVSYTVGPNNFYLTYTMAGEDDAAQFANTATEATMISAAYVYDLSKRTSVGITYSMIDNDANANYNFFTGTSLGSPDAATGRGEDPTLIQFTLRHAF